MERKQSGLNSLAGFGVAGNTTMFISSNLTLCCRLHRASPLDCKCLAETWVAKAVTNSAKKRERFKDGSGRLSASLVKHKKVRATAQALNASEKTRVSSPTSSLTGVYISRHFIPALQNKMILIFRIFKGRA